MSEARRGCSYNPVLGSLFPSLHFQLFFACSKKKAKKKSREWRPGMRLELGMTKCWILHYPSDSPLHASVKFISFPHRLRAGMIALRTSTMVRSGESCSKRAASSLAWETKPAFSSLPNIISNASPSWREERKDSNVLQ